MCYAVFFCAEMKAKMPPSPTPQFSESVTVKLTARQKKTIQRLAFENDDAVCRMIRRALVKEYPELKLQ